jgi:hypothetical protein
VGETGSGKTTLLALLANAISGRAIEEFTDIVDYKNENLGQESQSQTQTSKLYSIHTPDGKLVRILDTPGLADTRGIDMDNMHRANIIESINDCFVTIDAAIIVANGTLERFGAATDYAIRTINGMFPHTALHNIGFTFTNVADELAFNFNFATLPLKLSNSKYWTIQNPLALMKRARAKMIAQESTMTLDQKKRLERSLRLAHAEATGVLDEALQWLDSLKAQDVGQIYQLYRLTTDIETNLAILLGHVRELEGRQTALLDTRNKLKAYQQVRQIISESFACRSDTF